MAVVMTDSILHGLVVNPLQGAEEEPMRKPDAAYHTVACDDFVAMIDVGRYSKA
jgi:hypothetical protein